MRNFEYRLFERYFSDCIRYIKGKINSENRLMGCNVNDHIHRMKELYELLPEKPKKISYNDLSRCERMMRSKGKNS